MKAFKFLLTPLGFFLIVSQTSASGQTNAPALPFIDQLQNNESYTIEIFSSGCFHQSSQKLLIQRKKDVYTATKNKKVVTLSENAIAELRVFEAELTKTRNNHCTSTDIYKVKYKNQVLSHTDGSCTWHGGNKLIRVLFGND